MYTYYPNTHALENPQTYTHPLITKQVTTTTVPDTHQMKESHCNQAPSVQVRPNVHGTFIPNNFALTHSNPLHFRIKSLHINHGSSLHITTVTHNFMYLHSVFTWIGHTYWQQRSSEFKPIKHLSMGSGKTNFRTDKHLNKISYIKTPLYLVGT